MVYVPENCQTSPTKLTDGIANSPLMWPIILLHFRASLLESLMSYAPASAHRRIDA